MVAITRSEKQTTNLVGSHGLQILLSSFPDNLELTSQAHSTDSCSYLMGGHVSVFIFRLPCVVGGEKLWAEGWESL